ANAFVLTSQYQLVPLSAYPQFHATGDYNPPINVPVTRPNPDFVGAPITSSPGFWKPGFFEILAETALRNPPSSWPAPEAGQLVRDGLTHKNEPTPAIVSEVNAMMLNQMRTQRTHRHGWSLDLKAGDYGMDYLNRAATARFGFGANVAADAVYLSAATDRDGNPLLRTENYVTPFPPDGTPPARGFWSLTGHDQSGFLIANPVNRYTIGSETGLVTNEDGSIDILLRNKPPTKRDTNWPPTPLAPFNLTLRIYWPEQSVLNGAYAIPQVEQADT